MTIHRRILRVPTKETAHGIAPDIALPPGVNVVALEYGQGGTCVVECWLSDITHDRELLSGLLGEELKSHPRSPETIGQVFVGEQFVDQARKTAHIGEAVVPYRKEVAGRTGRLFILDEG